MTKKQMQARITELETLVASLNAAVAALSAAQHPLILTQPQPYTSPNINPVPPPFPMPYIGDPPYPWGPTIGTATGGFPQAGSIKGEGGLTVFCKGACATNELGRVQEG
jgi:hypothetical protein